jgi:tetratricopeptide (TPR) repeat protein
MDEIMGGKPGTSPLRPQPAAEAAAPEPVRDELSLAEPVEELSEAVLAVTEDEELLPAEDALAFLEDLTAPEATVSGELPDVIYAPAAEEGTRPLEMPAGEAVAEEEVEAPVAEIGFWLQTAEDEGGEPIPDDYFERAARAQPAAPALPLAEAEAVPALLPIGAEEFQARLEADPSDDEARLGLARVWWASGDRTQSLEIYQQLIEDDLFLDEVAGDLRRDVEAFDNAGWYRALGDAHMKLGNLAQALDAYRQALTRL